MTVRTDQTSLSSHLTSTVEAWIIRCHHHQLTADDFARIADRAMIARTELWTWIRLTCNRDGSAYEDDLTYIRQLTATLPGTRWRVIGNRLVQPGKRVPDLDLPELSWQSVQDVVSFRLPPIQVAARIANDQKLSLQLIRGGMVTACKALLTDVQALACWIQTAPETRIRTLRWVCTSKPQSRCIILGEKLPPVDGIPFIAQQRILIPAGYCWQPAVSVADVRQVFNLSANQWLLWESDQSHSTIDDDAFATLSRASVRELLAIHIDASDDVPITLR